MRNYLTKFKAIDFISDTFHTYITTLSQQLQEHISTNSSQLHFNKLFNNYSDRSSTTLLITNFHNIMQELVKIIHHILSQHFHNIFTTYFIDNKHQYSFMWQIFNKLITTLSQTLHRIFQQLSTHLHHASTNSSTNTSTNSFTTFFTTFFIMRIIHFNKCIRKSWYNVRHMLYNLFTTLLQLHHKLSQYTMIQFFTISCKS